MYVFILSDAATARAAHLITGAVVEKKKPIYVVLK